MFPFKIYETGSVMYFDFTNCKLTQQTVKKTSELFIQKIIKNYPPPYTLLLSGGIDSQAMLQCWINANAPFKAITIKFENDLNMHDIGNVEIYAKDLNVKVEYIDFNIINFLENNLNDYVTRYNCASPQICAHMAWVDLIKEGTVLLSGSPPFLNRVEFTIDLLPFYTFIDINKSNCIPYFFLEDLDTCSAFLSLQKNFWKDSNPNNEFRGQGFHFYSKKCELYTQANFKIYPQYNKFSGFEQVKELYDSRHDLTSPKERLQFNQMPSKRIFDIIYRYRNYKTINRIDKRIEAVVPSEFK